MATTNLKDPKTILVDVPLDQIAPSGTNPRTDFPEDYINELAASISETQVEQPIVLRTKSEADQEDIERATAAGLPKAKYRVGDELFVIVAGECRWRASIIAGKATIPAVIRELTDLQIRKLQITENMHRRGLTPLEEAYAYDGLIKEGLTQQDIADQIFPGGKRSVQYINATVKLCLLNENGKALLKAEFITASHAVLVARLASEDQDQALSAILGLEGWVAVNGASTSERWLKDAQEQRDKGISIISEKATRAWIRDNVNCDLSKVPWKLDEKFLCAGGESCLACQYRSGSDPGLFGAEIAEGDSRCTRPAFFQDKHREYAKAKRKEVDEKVEESGRKLVRLSPQESKQPPNPAANLLKAGQWVEAKKGSCPDTVEGILRDGPDAGNTKYVCGNVDCDVHEHPGFKKKAEPPKGISEKERHQHILDQARKDAEGQAKIVIAQTVVQAELRRLKSPDAWLLRKILDVVMLSVEMVDIDQILLQMGVKLGPHEDADGVLSKLRKSDDIAVLTRLALLFVLPEIDVLADHPELKVLAQRSKVDLRALDKKLFAQIKRFCHYCGCTELTPCAGQCSWLPKDSPATAIHPDVCSFCEKKALDEVRDRAWNAPAKSKQPSKPAPKAKAAPKNKKRKGK